MNSNSKTRGYNCFCITHLMSVDRHGTMLVGIHAHNALIENNCRCRLMAATDRCWRVDPDLTWLPALGQCAAPGLLAAADVRAS
jgi:hypothetical protein